jgi:Outer membrane protein beta-barrel domain
MFSARSLVGAALLLLTSSIPTRAQDSDRRAWALLGLGTGSANIACDGCTSGWNLHGPTLLGTGGLMLTPHWGVGIGLDQWWRSPADSEATSLGTVMLRYYPITRAGAFVEAGVGYSRAEVRLDGSRVAKGRSWGLMAAVGYDVRVLRWNCPGSTTCDLMLTPRVSYVYSPMGDVRYAAGSPPFATGWRHQVLSVGLGVGLSTTFHPVRQE